LRLSLFQVTVGMALVLLVGTLNRVMIVELERARDAGGRHDFAAASVRAVPRADRLPLRHPQIRAGLAPRSLHLEGHDAAIRRLRDHALRASGAVGLWQAADAPLWIGLFQRRAGLPAGRRGRAHRADRGPGARHRPVPVEDQPKVVG
jgi:BCD family chlorophyll transporter-like MFS transporter